MRFEQWLFGKSDQIALLEQWRTCVEFGMTTKDFCQKLKDNGSDATKKIGQAGLDAPGKGVRFTDVLEGWLSPVVVSTLVIAERNGQLKEGLDIALRELSGGQGVMMGLFMVLFWPLLTLIGLGVLGVYISGEIIATASLTGSMADQWRLWVQGPGVFALTLALGLLALSALSMPWWTGPLRHTIDGVWLFSHYRIAAAANLLSTLANLSRAGMNLVQAIEEISPYSSRYLNEHLTQMKTNLATQSNPGKALDTGLLLADAQTNLDVMGDIAPLPLLLEKSAAQHQQILTQSLTRMRLWLPKIILVLAIVLLLSLVGSAMASLFASIQHTAL
ncbi:type II secretion system F family protein [Vibrio sp. TBV020]|uniref:type II secretion system F family protein n=1 Tax=Vibrio sp. TBV020 TaxID=3137398 RepID=UPI0038CDC876